MKNLWSRIRAVWYELTRANSTCDGCHGRFHPYTLNPCSGDWDLCDDCFRKHIAP
jgi:hypothetical protein